MRLAVLLASLVGCAHDPVGSIYRRGALACLRIEESRACDVELCWPEPDPGRLRVTGRTCHETVALRPGDVEI